jgi:N6-adenosine-specific RNA methylase IME4
VRHEKLYICTRGSCQPDVPKLFDSVQEIERTNKHSEKPQEFRQIIDTLYPSGPRIELFQRGDAVPAHWHVWGAEAADAEVEAAA